MKNIISDWLEKYGDPKIAEQVKKEAELLNKINEMKTTAEINEIIKLQKDITANGERLFETDEISDGWHTFGDLYDFRLAYNALAFNALNLLEHKTMVFYKEHEAEINPSIQVHKSWKHHDGEYCFGEEKKWFIVAAKLPTGIITNHYKAEYWDLFQIPETDKSIFPFDGHTANDALDRIFKFLKQK